jgi:hypothetical protein
VISILAHQQEKRIKNTEMKFKFIEGPKYREKNSQISQLCYKQKQEQLQGRREQLCYYRYLISLSQQKIESTIL